MSALLAVQIVSVFTASRAVQLKRSTQRQPI